jgi:hypothetical protein
MSTMDSSRSRLLSCESRADQTLPFLAAWYSAFHLSHHARAPEDLRQLGSELVLQHRDSS